jgi:NTP pyrophosphatase (non-canonical NTP hydrolase)
MQNLMRETVAKLGHLWDRNWILLKIMEEMGELAQAFRKKSRSNQLHEFGDVLFALLALAEREHIDALEQFKEAVSRFEVYCAEVSEGPQYLETRLTSDYPSWCVHCGNVPVYKSSRLGICPDCSKPEEVAK